MRLCLPKIIKSQKAQYFILYIQEKLSDFYLCLIANVVHPILKGIGQRF